METTGVDDALNAETTVVGDARMAVLEADGEGCKLKVVWLKDDVNILSGRTRARDDEYELVIVRREASKQVLQI